MTKNTVKPEIHTIRGKTKYNRVFTPQKGGSILDKDTGEMRKLPDIYGTVLLIDDINREQMLDLVENYSLSNSPKRDKERDESFPFKREVEYGTDGTDGTDGTTVLNPIQYIVDEEGNSLSLHDLKEQGSDGIGNGSECTIAFRLQSYNTSMGKRHKAILVGIQVHKLVPYTRPQIEETNPFPKKVNNTKKTGNPFS